MRLILITLTCALLSGCSLPFKNDEGTTYHLILGVGLVTTNSNQTDAVVATRSKVLGINISDQPGIKLGVGYSSSKTVSVAEGGHNVVVEIEDNPVGDLVVKIDRRTLSGGDDDGNSDE